LTDRGKKTGRRGGTRYQGLRKKEEVQSPGCYFARRKRTKLVCRGKNWTRAVERATTKGPRGWSWGKNERATGSPVGGEGGKWKEFRGGVECRPEPWPVPSSRHLAKSKAFANIGIWGGTSGGRWARTAEKVAKNSEINPRKIAHPAPNGADPWRVLAKNATPAPKVEDNWSPETEARLSAGIGKPQKKWGKERLRSEKPNNRRTSGFCSPNSDRGEETAGK